MKIGKLIVFSFLIGIVLIIVGYSMGGMRSVSFTRKGIIIDDFLEMDTIFGKKGEITDISVSIISGNIKILEGDYNFEIKSSNKFPINHTFEKGKLVIEQETLTGFNIGFFNPAGESEVIIYIPEGKVVSSANLSTVSGKISLEGSRFNRLKLKSVSGRIEASGINTVNLDADNVSGGINVSGRITGSGNMSVVSGKIDVDIDGDIRDYSLDMHTISGGLYVNGENMKSKNYKTPNNGDRRIMKLSSTSGGVIVNFSK